MANVETVPGFDRRHFLRFSLGAGAGLAAASLSHSALAQQTVAKQREAGGKGAKSVIMFWMGGGPTQYETFDPKPGTKNGGTLKAIDTTIPGTKFGELMPTCAKAAKHMSIIRSMSTGEGAHERGTSLMHIGMTPIAGLEIPSTGTVVAVFSSGTVVQVYLLEIGGDLDAGTLGELARKDLQRGREAQVRQR